ncbi:MAG: phytanoyl-CoA dioxygenase family protein [Oligoflexales bacterium]
MYKSLLQRKVSKLTRYPIFREAVISWRHINDHMKSAKDEKLNKDESDLYARVQEHGYAVVENFFSEEVCKRLIADARAAEERYTDFVQRYSNGADKRVFGIDSLGGLFSDFSDNALGRKIATLAFGEPTTCIFTLLGHLSYTQENIGSGEGWHRDSFNRQLKAIVYLSDVGEKSGPFQYIEKSHQWKWMIRDHFFSGIGGSENRVSEGKIEKMIRKFPERLKTFTARAGTLILANTSGIHRGKPILQGERWALTNYYYPTTEVTENLIRHFAPVLRPENVERAPN